MMCFERTASPEQLESHRHSEQTCRNAKCKYCDAPAVGGSMSFVTSEVMDEENEFWCKPCRLDLVEFDTRPENEIPDFPFDDEAAQERVSQQMGDLERRRQEFMRQKVRERSQ